LFFAQFDLFHKGFKFGIGIDTVGINNSSTYSISGFDRIDNRLIIWVTDTFKAMMLQNRKFLGFEPSPAVNGAKGIIEKLMPISKVHTT